MKRRLRAHTSSSHRLPASISACIAALISVATLPATAEGEINYYQASKLSSYTQTTTAQPAAADFWRFAGLLVYSPDEVLSASIAFDVPPPTTVEMIQAASHFHVFYSDNYSSREDLDLAHPSTTYTFTLERGAGPESEDVFLPVDLYPPEIPYMTGDTYDRLQSYAVSQPFDLYVNGFTALPGASVVQNNVMVAEAGVGLVFSISMAPEDTLVQIPAGLLLPSTNYDITVQYFSSVDTPDAGFGTATSAASFLRDTSASFTTLPATPEPCCRGDFNNDAQFNALDIQGFVDALLAAESCP